MRTLMPCPVASARQLPAHTAVVTQKKRALMPLTALAAGIGYQLAGGRNRSASPGRTMPWSKA